MYVVRKSRSVSLRVGFVHKRNLARDSRPFKFSSKRLAASLALELFPFEEFVCETKVWLNDYIQSSRSYKAAG
jgi:hypothetical protein